MRIQAMSNIHYRVVLMFVVKKRMVRRMDKPSSDH